jgi:hypothetical protein
MSVTRPQAGRPYPRVSSSEYSRLVQRFQEIVSTTVPRDAIVLVPSRGDEALLELGQRRGWHFPQEAASGKYAGHYPEDGAAVVTHLQELIAAGAGYLAFPRTSLWWLDYYGELRQYLERQGKVLADQDECMLFELPLGKAVAEPQQPQAVSQANGAPAGALDPFTEVVTCLVPAGARIGVLGPDVDAASPLERQGYEVLAISARDADASQRELLAAEGRGARFVVLTSPASGWLDSLPELRAHLAREYEFVTRQRELCEIFERLPQSPQADDSHRDEPQQQAVDSGGRRSVWSRLRSLLGRKDGA